MSLDDSVNGWKDTGKRPVERSPLSLMGPFTGGDFLTEIPGKPSDSTFQTPGLTLKQELGVL